MFPPFKKLEDGEYQIFIHLFFVLNHATRVRSSRIIYFDNNYLHDRVLEEFIFDLIRFTREAFNQSDPSKDENEQVSIKPGPFNNVKS